MSEETYENAMSEARAAMERRNWAEAYRHFGRAHDLGHDVLADHLAAHRGMIRAAWRGGRVDRVLRNVVLLIGGALFDRDAKPASR
ncbi:DUF3703 domain-containing protein [Amycolatopsis sp. CA-230715]|uniref:DUF3703 domain-containing protein n=1 Tax=Amycolatopsis sp. CA-230715 TaxID=2745196 RepID=UPI001C009AAD|nr:DUF3703 domain-containing protein [Amycolatopsis sp. CA-230715]QWF78481.1 hypothetical protein HUW46_01877 [Amycolatopsis sp. CA-230715]